MPNRTVRPACAPGAAQGARRRKSARPPTPLATAMVRAATTAGPGAAQWLRRLAAGDDGAATPITSRR
jgi:hypothetical protein